jgi:hypothetical protein
MKEKPINKKIHHILISKGYTWKPKIYFDMYHKDDIIIFIYFYNYMFMLINGKVATQKEFEDATQLSS